MWNTLTEAIVTIVLAIVGLAVITSLVSRNARTSDIIRSAASGLGNDIAVAQAPVTGIQINPNLSYPGFGS